jgi:thioredoxin reductase
MNYENIIIGAGPAGLQAAYYLKKYDIEYLILERSDKCGSFFDNYPCRSACTGCSTGTSGDAL